LSFEAATPGRSRSALAGSHDIVTGAAGLIKVRHLWNAFPRTISPRKDVMEERDFEGTLVLEQLAAIGKVDDFFDAIDSDDVDRAVALMKRAKVGAPTIAIVVKEMEESDGEH
jgi:hypothetical protein